MIERVAKVLVDAGATYRSAVRAAAIIDAGGSVEAARRELVDAEAPAEFDAMLLLAEIGRQREWLFAEASRG